MAWSVMLGSAHNMHLPKDEHLIAPLLSPGSQDLVRGALKRQRQPMTSRQDEADEDDLMEELGNPAEKKRRLTIEQVKFLEMSFNKDLKLEPERKALIAKQLGLRPRQVAIWFQNRRARWKNKQLEQDFETLKAKFDAAVEENENIMKEREAVLLENKKLMAEVDRLKSLLQVHESRGIPEASYGGGTSMGKLLLSLETESGFKEEQLSGKSELTSPTKSSDDQSEVQDSGRSYVISSEGATMDIPDLSCLPEFHSAGACASTVKPELEYPALAWSDELFGNFFNPLVFQLAANGVFSEDACNFLLNWEDQLHGHIWRG